MFTMIFDPAKIPRSMTRAQWREASRWLRICAKKIRAEMRRPTVAIWITNPQPDTWVKRFFDADDQR